MIKKVLTSPYFYIPAILAGIGLLVLLYRWWQCRKENGTQPHCATTPCDFIFANCSFWTGKPIVADATTKTCDDGSVIASSDTCPSAPDNGNVSVAGKVDLWCENGKYYKRTSTAVYGVLDKLELTKAEFDALVITGISYSGNC